MRRAKHAVNYARRGSSPAWQPGHQYAIRLSSPCPHERIVVPAARARLARRGGRRGAGGRGRCRRDARISSAADLERTAAVVLGARRAAGATARAPPPTAPRPATCSRSRRRATGRAASRRTSASGRRARMPLEHRVELRRALEDVRAEPRERARVQLEHRAVPEHALDVLAAEHEPRLARRAPRRAGGPTSGRSCAGASAGRCRPRSGGCRFLPCALHRFELSPVDPLGDALGLRARMRRLGRDPLADEHLQAARRPVERIPLGHVSHRSGRGRLASRASS